MNDETAFVAVKVETSLLPEVESSIAKPSVDVAVQSISTDIDTIDEMDSFGKIKSERKELVGDDQSTSNPLIEDENPTAEQLEMQFECVSMNDSYEKLEFFQI